MDYVVGSVAALVSGNVTPNRPRLVKRALTPIKHQPSPNVTPKSEVVGDRSIFLSPTMQKKKAVAKKSPKRIFQNPALDESLDEEGGVKSNIEKAEKAKKHLKDELEANPEVSNLLLSPKSPKNKKVAKADNTLDKSITLSPKKIKKQKLSLTEAEPVENNSEKENEVETSNAEAGTENKSKKNKKNKKNQIKPSLESAENESKKENETEVNKSETATLTKSQKRRMKKKQKAQNKTKPALEAEKQENGMDNASPSKLSKKQKKIPTEPAKTETNITSDSNDKQDDNTASENKKTKKRKNRKKNKKNTVTNDDSINTKDSDEEMDVDEEASEVESKKSKKNKVVNPNAITDKDSDSEHESDDEIESDNEEITEEFSKEQEDPESSEDEEDKEKEKPVKEKKNKKLAEPKVRDENELQRTLFVGNVPFSAKTKKELKKIFSKYGKIETVRIRNVPVKDGRVTPKLAVIKNELHPDRQTVNAYIKYTSPDAVDKALIENNRELNSCHLRVSRSDSSGAEHDTNLAVYVGNVPFACEDETLRAKFEKCGEITSVRIVRDRTTNAGKGFAYVNFASKDGVELALSLTEEDLTIKNRILRVNRCLPPNKQNKNRPESKFKRPQGQQSGPPNRFGGQNRQGPPNRQGGFNRPNGQNRPGGFNKPGGQNRPGGFNRPGGQNRQGGQNWQDQNRNQYPNKQNSNSNENEGALRRLSNKRKNEENTDASPNKEKKVRKEFVGITSEKKKKSSFSKGLKKKKLLSEILSK